MKSKKKRALLSWDSRWGEFHLLRRHLLLYTVGLALISVGIIYGIYSIFLHGRFAEWMVHVFMTVLRVDYLAAMDIYQVTFRNHETLVMYIGEVIVFGACFALYLRRFTRYFLEIDTNMEKLVQGGQEEIALTPELLPMERKMISIRETIQQQKDDLLATEQRKNDLIVYLAHDLKTPLASVIGYLTLLHDEEEIPTELREKYLGIALDKAERLEDLINEFFEIARFNLSNISLQRHRVNLTRLMEQLIFEFQPMLREKGLLCTLDMPEDVMYICDADKLQRVFDNLLRNAVLYSWPETEIVIQGAARENAIELTFTNHGDTIPQDKLDRLFEQFYRLDSARGTSGGAGLGLAIAKQIVELHGGTIAARSWEDLISFTVILPRDGVGKS